METRLGFTRQMTKGFETRTFTTHFQQGSGFKMRTFTTWKNEFSGEISWSTQKWFKTEEECWEDMQHLIFDHEQMGWS